MSDWGATHSLSIEQGLDQEMGFDYHNRFFNEIELSKIPSETLDRSMNRLFTQFFKIGSFDQPIEDFRNITANVTTHEHKKLAQ
jgi:beta-glucosidase